MPKIIKIIDERETQKQKTKSKKKITTQKQKQTNEKNKSKKTQNDIESNNDIESIKSNPTKNAYPLFLIDKVIKNTSIISFLVTKTNQKTHLTFITLNYNISATCHTILKTHFLSFATSFVKKMLTKTQFLMIWNLS